MKTMCRGRELGSASEAVLRGAGFFFGDAVQIPKPRTALVRSASRLTAAPAFLTISVSLRTAARVCRHMFVVCINVALTEHHLVEP